MDGSGGMAGLQGFDWLVGGGALGALVRTMDWSSTPLGPRERWPQSLRTALGITLACRRAACVLWGEEWRLIYNDAGFALAGGRASDGLGRPVRQGWPALWTRVAPLFDAVMRRGEPARCAGGEDAADDAAGRAAASFAFDVVPLRLEDGTVGGAIVTVDETSDLGHLAHAFAQCEESLGTAIAGVKVALQSMRTRDSYLAELEGELRHLHGTDAILRAASRRLCERLAADRCLYASVIGDGTAEIRAAYPGAASPVWTGRVVLEGEEILEPLRRGEDVIVADLASEPSVSERGRATLRDLGIRAVMAAALPRDGTPGDVLVVHSATPRAWTALDRALLHETAWHTAATLERARVEEQQRICERMLAEAESVSHTGSWEWDLVTGAPR